MGACIAPAYGRDYANEDEAKHAWKEGRDFILYHPSHRLNGHYVTIGDMIAGDYIEIQFKRRKQSAIFTKT